MEKLPSADEAVEALKKDLTGYDEDFSFGILIQLGALSLTKDPHGAGVLFARSVLKKVRSGDHMEMLLVTQMLAVHDATMTYAALLGGSKNLPQLEICANTFNKLARTFTGQMEALQRLRSGTEQKKITVQNVSVSDGGQAIVGSVTHTGGSGTKTSRNPLLL